MQGELLSGWGLLFARGVAFTEAAAARIRDAIGGKRDIKPQTPRNTSAPDYMTPLLGKTDAAHNKGASGTVSVWTGTPGSESDSTLNITAYNRFQNLGSGKWVVCLNNGYGWYVAAGEC